MISLGDRLTLSRSDCDILTCNDPCIPTDSSNLVIKALRAYREATGECFPVHVHLEKRIPIQAGLGGGSSNAATMLWALNTLALQPVSEERLREIAASFSSDAPCFFSSGTACCRGRGEKIESIAEMPSTSLWIAKPREGLSTPRVYQHCRPELCVQRDPVQALTDLVEGKSHYFNDLEETAFLLMPSLAQLKKNLLKLGFSTATMTGSGTAFFCAGAPYQPQLEEVDFYPIAFVKRRFGNWYELPSV